FVVTGLFTWATNYFGAVLAGPVGSTLTAEGGLNASGPYYGLYLDGRTLINAAGSTATLSGASDYSSQSALDVQGGAVFENNGELDLSYASRIYSSTNYGTFSNNGLIVQSTGSGYFSLPFDNSGTVQVQSGTFTMPAGGTSSGSFTGDSGTTLSLNGGVITLA